MNNATTTNKVQTTKKPLFEKTEKGLIVNEQVSAKKLQRELTKLQSAKSDLKIKAKSVRNSFEHNLKIVKDNCKSEAQTYLKELNSKYNLSLSPKEFWIILCDVKLYRNYLTEAQQLKVEENRMNYTPSTIIELIGRYFKANKIVLPKK